MNKISPLFKGEKYLVKVSQANKNLHSDLYSRRVKHAAFLTFLEALCEQPNCCKHIYDVKSVQFFQRMLIRVDQQWLDVTWLLTWWRHQMETFLRYWPLARRIHRRPVNSPHKVPWSTRSFDVFFDVNLKKRISKQSRCRWFYRPWRSLSRHDNVKWSVISRDLSALISDDL